MHPLREVEEVVEGLRVDPVLDLGEQTSFPVLIGVRGFGIDRFRTAIARACKAAGVPVFSPHDLRHRRATLWHLQGVPIADAAAWLGHSPAEHLATYAHATLVDRNELKYPDLLRSARVVHTPVTPREQEYAV